LLIINIKVVSVFGLMQNYNYDQMNLQKEILKKENEQISQDKPNEQKKIKLFQKKK
jgi:cell division protein FtsB